MRYYDFHEQEPPDEDGLIDIERVYTFDWRRFDDAAWDRLMAIYRALPEWQDGLELMAWFGPLDATPGLAASVEPPGLHVFGRLPLPSWAQWDREFLLASQSLPWRED